MPRPKEHGPTVGVRLVNAAHDELIRRAKRLDVSPGEYLRRQIEPQLLGVVSSTTTEPQAPPRQRQVTPVPKKSAMKEPAPPAERAVAGSHPGWYSNAFGSVVCTACGKLRSRIEFQPCER